LKTHMMIIVNLENHMMSSEQSHDMAHMMNSEQSHDDTDVKYPLLRACSSSAALRAAGLHTHVRTHRTSSDPAYLHTYVYLYMKRVREEEECCYFRNPGLKKTFG
jgi:hypothetical protein